LLSLSFLVVVHDGTKSIADQRIYISATGTTWENTHPSSLSALRPVVERMAGTSAWQGTVEPYLLEQPVSLVLAIIGAILILLGQRKKGVIV
jgi:hypothetical protein